MRLNQEQLNQELSTSRRLSDQQLLTINTKNQDSLNKMTLELDRIRRRLNEYERFTNVIKTDILIIPFFFTIANCMMYFYLSI